MTTTTDTRHTTTVDLNPTPPNPPSSPGNPPPNPPKEKFSNSPAFAVVCTLAGVLITALASYAVANRTAAAGEEQACIARVDVNQKNLQDKSAEFIGTVGDLVNYTIFPPSNKPEDLEKVVKPLIKNGYILSAYAPDSLSVIALKITQSVQVASLGSMGGGNEQEAMNTIKDSYGKWPAVYKAEIKRFDEQRLQCKK